MLGEISKDVKAIGGLLRYCTSSSITVEAAEKEIKFSTPNLSSRWELNFVKNAEKDVFEKMLSEMDEEDTFYDIGANIGFYTCFFSEKASKSYSFEPNKHAAQILRENIEENSLENVEVIEAAASDRNTSIKLSKAPGTSVFGTAQIKDSEEGEIEARKVDGLFEEGKVELPDMVKIDVEGHEIEVLKGMEEVIEKASPVIYVESHENHEELRETLEEQGYQLQRLKRRIEGNIFYRAEPE